MIISQASKRPLGLDLAENRLELPYGAHVLPDGQKLLGRIGRKLFLPRPPIGVHLNVGQMDRAACKYFFWFFLYGAYSEIFARETGFNRGLGGSMHAFFTPFGIYPNNA